MFDLKMQKKNIILTEEENFRIQNQHPRICFIDFKRKETIPSLVSYTNFKMAILSFT